MKKEKEEEEAPFTLRDALWDRIRSLYHEVVADEIIGAEEGDKLAFGRGLLEGVRHARLVIGLLRGTSVEKDFDAIEATLVEEEVRVGALVEHQR